MRFVSPELSLSPTPRRGCRSVTKPSDLSPRCEVPMVTCFDQSRHRCHRFEGEFHKLHSCKDFRWKTHEHMEAPPWVAMSRHGKHISVYHGFSTLRRLLYIMFYVYINIYREIYIYTALYI